MFPNMNRSRFNEPRKCDLMVRVSVLYYHRFHHVPLQPQPPLVSTPAPLNKRHGIVFIYFYGNPCRRAQQTSNHLTEGDGNYFVESPLFLCNSAEVLVNNSIPFADSIIQMTTSYQSEVGKGYKITILKIIFSPIQWITVYQPGWSFRANHVLLP